MANVVRILLKVDDANGVRDALKGIRQAVTEAEAASTAAVKQGAAERTAARKAEAAAARAEKKAALAEDKSIEAAARNASRALKKEDREREKAEEKKAHAEKLRQNSEVKSRIDRIFNSGRETDRAAFGHLGNGGMLGSGISAGAVAGIAAFVGGIMLATTALKSLGNFVLQDVIKPQFALETRAAQIANNSGGQVSTQSIIDTSRAEGIRNNMDPQQIAETIANASSAKFGTEMIGTIATMSKSRGVPMEDLMSLANPLAGKMSIEAIKGLLPSLAAQGVEAGKSGKFVGIGTLGKGAEQFLGMSELFAGDDVTRIREAGALTQAGARGGFRASPIMGVSNFFTEALGSKALQAKFGSDFTKNATTGATQIADPTKLIGDIMMATKGGNADGLKALGLAETGGKYLSAFKTDYNTGAEASKAAGGSDVENAKAGAAAVVEALKKVELAHSDMAAEESGRSKVMQTTGQIWESAINGMKERLVDAMPQIREFVLTLAQNAPQLASAMLTITSAIVSAAQFILDAAARIEDLVTFHAEGDVRTSSINMGADTKLRKAVDHNGGIVPGHFEDTGTGLINYVQDSADEKTRQETMAMLNKTRKSRVVDGEFVYQGFGAKDDNLFPKGDSPDVIPAGGRVAGDAGGGIPWDPRTGPRNAPEHPGGQGGAANTAAAESAAKSLDGVAKSAGTLATALDMIARNASLLHGPA